MDEMLIWSDSYGGVVLSLGILLTAVPLQKLNLKSGWTTRFIILFAT